MAQSEQLRLDKILKKTGNLEKVEIDVLTGFKAPNQEGVLTTEIKKIISNILEAADSYVESVNHFDLNASEFNEAVVGGYYNTTFSKITEINWFQESEIKTVLIPKLAVGLIYGKKFPDSILYA